MFVHPQTLATYKMRDNSLPYISGSSCILPVRPSLRTPPIYLQSHYSLNFPGKGGLKRGSAELHKGNEMQSSWWTWCTPNNFEEGTRLWCHWCTVVLLIISRTEDEGEAGLCMMLYVVLLQAARLHDVFCLLQEVALVSDNQDPAQIPTLDTYVGSSTQPIPMKFWAKQRAPSGKSTYNHTILLIVYCFEQALSIARTSAKLLHDLSASNACRKFKIAPNIALMQSRPWMTSSVLMLMLLYPCIRAISTWRCPYLQRYITCRGKMRCWWQGQIIQIRPQLGTNEAVASLMLMYEQFIWTVFLYFDTIIWEVITY